MKTFHLEKPTTAVYFRVLAVTRFFERVKLVFLRIHKTASSVERFLILFAALASTWFTFFDVYPPSDILGEFAVKSLFWTALYFSLVAAHFTALYIDGYRARRRACLYHAIVWAVWVLLAYTATRPTMATPLAFGLASMALYDAIRFKLKENASV